MKNLAASVKQLLLNRAETNQEDFNLVQVRFAVERLLYRLSVSRFAERFLLKGAMLFVLWEPNPHRPTRDVDLLCLDSFDRQQFESIFREIAIVDVSPDGLRFDADSIRVDDIRDGNAYGGIRVKLQVFLGSGKIPVQIDVGMGDAVYPEPTLTDFTPLLEFPAPKIRAYPVHSVVAEKFQAIVELASSNTRLKDYFDIHYLQQKFEYDGQDLHRAIAATFKRRRTRLPVTIPDGLSEAFWASPQKRAQWTAFLRKNHFSPDMDLEEVCREIAEFVMPVVTTETFDQRWRPGKGWSS